jgi:mono/diheme cytochrome c family protein
MQRTRLHRSRAGPLLAVQIALFASVAALAAEPQPKPFAAGDARTGEAMANRDCIGCHARQFNGDPEKIYLRSDRRVKTPAQLLAQVQTCNTQLGMSYFPEEEEHVAAYLNLHYYKFK